MKKIALLIGDISAEFQSELAISMYQRAKEYGYTIHAFVVYGLYGVNSFHAYNELSSLLIPDFSEYDVVVTVTSTFEAEGLFEKFKKTVLNQVVCPVISVRSEDPDYYSVIYDNYQTMRQMVEHFIEHHHMKKIAFVSGPISRKDASERYRAYRDVMSEHRLPVDEDHMVFYGNFWKNEGVRIVNHLLSDPDHIPEAIICANDYMAEATAAELQNRGYRIPEDICISGYDDLIEAQLLTPPLTSVHVDTAGLGQRTIDLAASLINKEEVPRIHMHPSAPVFRGSCGCPSCSNSELMNTMFQKWQRMSATIDNITNLSNDFATINTYTDLIHDSIPYISNCYMNRIYVCLCDQAEKRQEEAEMASKFTNNITLKTILGRDSYKEMNISFPRSEILPKEYLDTIEFPIITSIFNRDNFMGYFVAESEGVLTLPHSVHILRCWFQEFSATLHRLSVYDQNIELQRFLELSNHDELTGVLNRRGLEPKLREFSLKVMNPSYRFCVMSVDMDGLKFINDTYGHAEGDTAIRSLAQILSKTLRHVDVVARVGGDEFNIYLDTNQQSEVEEFLHKVYDEIDKYNLTSHRPYRLSASFGYDFCSFDKRLSEAQRSADNAMYEEKAQHKKNPLHIN